MVGFIITLVVVGLIAGALARLIVPGRQNLSIPMTILLGIIGSFVGGFLANLIFRNGGSYFQTSGIIGSVIGAIIVLLIYVRVGRGRSARA